MEKAFYKKDSQKVHLWVHLLFKASYSQNREELLGNKPYLCKPGEFTTGRRQLSLETGISESKIERILTYFEKIEQQIEQQKTSRNRLITILHWEEYQQSEQQSEQQVNNNRTTSEQQVNTLKEREERKKVKKERSKEKDILSGSSRNSCKKVTVLESGKPDDIPYKNIIDFLNKEINSQFKHTSKKNRGLIRARWTEGYREEDFYYVIKIKSEQWMNDNGFSKFLRPETLFSNKFEGYRNEKEESACKQPGLLAYAKKHGLLEDKE